MVFQNAADTQPGIGAADMHRPIPHHAITAVVHFGG